MRGLSKGIQDWEALKAKMTRDFDEKLSPNIAVAILISMIPKELQDLVFQWGSGGGVEV